MDKQNLTMLTDFYELTMANGYFLEGMGEKTVYFDLFYRRNPENGGYVVAAGLEPLIDYLKNIKFTEDDLAFLNPYDIESVEVLKDLAATALYGPRGANGVTLWASTCL